MIMILMTRNDCEEDKNNFEFKNGNYEETKNLHLVGCQLRINACLVIFKVGGISL